MIQNILKEMKICDKELKRDYHNLHQCPGIGFDVKDTYEYIYKTLIDIGYKPRKCGKSGIIADIGKGQGKVILLRADMDGLSIREESGLKFSSTNGNMHACGHDMHTSMLLGAARILKKYEGQINGIVRLMFQPAEEILEGAKDMIGDLVLENPKVNNAVMLHVLPSLPFDTGTVIVSSPGVSAPAADYFSIEVKGMGGHGAMPEKTIDPLNIGANILLALQNIKAKELAAGERAVITVCSIESGDAYNIIPDKVILRGTMRCFDEDIRLKIKNRIQEISANIGTAFRGEVRVSFDRGCPTLVNNENLSCHIGKIMIELLGKEKVYMSDELKGGKEGTGSEDFSYVSHKVPSVMIGLSAGKVYDGYKYGLHNPKVRFDENALVYGAAVYATCGLELSR